MLALGKLLICRFHNPLWIHTTILSLIWLFANCPKACAIVFSFWLSLLLTVNFCVKVWGTLKKDITIPSGISVSDNMTESETTANEIPKMTIIKDPFLKELQKI